MVERTNLDWNDLRYFLAAAREKTLSGAARLLGVKHSTIGRRISALERSLGAALFVRQPDGLLLTPLGQSVLSRVEEVERTVVGLQALVGSRKQHVRLACPSGFGIFLSSHLARFQQEFPAIKLELLSGSQPLDLKKGEAELAIRVGPIADQDLIARKLGDAGWSLYAADAYLRRHPAPADPRQLAGHDVLGYDRRLAGAPGARWIEQHGRGATIVLRSRELTDMLAAARGGLGLAVMPCMLAESDSSLRRLSPDVLGRNGIFLAYRRETLLVEPIRTVIDFIVRLMRDNAALVRGVPRS
jgi:DNA-binding transcriptional LysR family regulator